VLPEPQLSSLNVRLRAQHLLAIHLTARLGEAEFEAGSSIRHKRIRHQGLRCASNIAVKIDRVPAIDGNARQSSIPQGQLVTGTVPGLARSPPLLVARSAVMARVAVLAGAGMSRIMTVLPALAMADRV
jgi:hypothetical protein